MAAIGAAALGTARGKIEIDIADLRNIQAMTQKIGEAVARNLGQIDGGVKRTENFFAHLSRTIGGFKSELTALSVGAGLLTKFGLDGAKNLRNYTAAFRAFTHNAQETSAVMDGLTKKANQFGIEVTEVWQLGRALLPVMKGNTAELDKWVTRASLVASTNPLKSTTDASRAIQEYVAGQTISLQRLFNVDPNLIQEAQDKFQDVGEQLDYILQRMGATEAIATEMADAFVGVRNELTLLLSEGFTPLFQALQPILAGFRGWLEALRETSPAVATVGAGLTTLAAIGAPTLLLFNQMYESFVKLKQIGALSFLGRGLVLGGAAVVGANIGLGVSHVVGRATGNEGAANATFASIGETARKLLLIIGYHLNQATQTAVNFFARIGASFANGVATMLRAMAGFVRGLSSMIPGGFGSGLAGALEASAGGMQGLGQAGLRASSAYSQHWNKYFNEQFNPPTAATPGFGGALGGGDAGRDTSRDDAIAEWSRSVQQIERDAAQQRLDATREYEKQRTEAIASYELGLARESEDYARQRARALANLEKQIADIRENAADRTAEIEKSYNDRTTKIRADANERLAKLDADYQHDRERALSDHNDALADAASHLDAQAVYNEQKNFERQQSDAADAYSERRDEISAQMAETLAEEKKSHLERLEQSRAADEQRIADLQENFAEQSRLEDDDRNLRLQRQAEDHTRQLQQMEQTQAERLAQINTQAAQERAALDESFAAQLNSLGLHNAQWLKQQQEQQDASLKLFDNFWQSFQNRFLYSGTGGAAPAVSSPPTAYPTQFADGGWVRSTGLAMVHAGEFVQSRAMLASGRSGGATLNLSDGAIQIYAQPGMDANAIARAVRGELVALLQEAA